MSLVLQKLQSACSVESLVVSIRIGLVCVGSIVDGAPVSHHGIRLTCSGLSIDKYCAIDSFKRCQNHLSDGLFINIPIRILFTINEVIIELVLGLTGLLSILSHVIVSEGRLLLFSRRKVGQITSAGNVGLTFPSC